MSEELHQFLGVPVEHRLERTGTAWRQSKGQDRDIYEYSEYDLAGRLIAKYEVIEAMSMYPPFGKSKTFSKTTVKDGE